MLETNIKQMYIALLHLTHGNAHRPTHLPYFIEVAREDHGHCRFSRCVPGTLPQGQSSKFVSLNTLAAKAPMASRCAMSSKRSGRGLKVIHWLRSNAALGQRTVQTLYK